MFGTHDLALFVVSCVLLNITPGADTLFVATRSASQGLKAGVAAALGIGSGCLVHVLAAAVGLSAVLAASSWAFTLMKYVGAAYLVYIGLSFLFKKDKPAAASAAQTPAITATPLPLVWRQGFLTNVLNPKVALFFLAFMPQFIDAAAPQKALAFVLLGAIFTCTGTLWCICVAWLSARLRSLQVGRGVVRWLERVVGGLFVALGIRLAVTD